jgi:hypothetical protein
LICLLRRACLAAETDIPELENPLVYQIKPSETDPSIRLFDDSHLVVLAPGTRSSAQLVVFMPGSHGRPANAATLLRVIAAQGYRVIGLEYNDVPAVSEVCEHSRSPTCAGDFRRRRVFADNESAPVANPPQESIVNRLVKLLEYLVRTHPSECWAAFLHGDQPSWDRIVVSGLSQGAGMAAYIAKNVRVARVVLFSSPWDVSIDNRRLAPWLSEPSATPPDRWFAEYHKREQTARLISRAYRLLRIPRDHILVFDQDIPEDLRNRDAANPFHGSTIRASGYRPQWRLMFGRSP